VRVFATLCRLKIKAVVQPLTVNVNKDIPSNYIYATHALSSLSSALTFSMATQASPLDTTPCYPKQSICAESRMKMSEALRRKAMSPKMRAAVVGKVSISPSLHYVSRYSLKSEWTRKPPFQALAATPGQLPLQWLKEPLFRCLPILVIKRSSMSLKWSRQVLFRTMSFNKL